jgi:hypothetical protein
MSAAFVRQQLIAPMEPPRSTIGTPSWLWQKLFGSVLNAVLTDHRGCPGGTGLARNPLLAD